MKARGTKMFDHGAHGAHGWGQKLESCSFHFLWLGPPCDPSGSVVKTRAPSVDKRSRSGMDALQALGLGASDPKRVMASNPHRITDGLRDIVFRKRDRSP
jgi:hypothetical protein